jgi:hypothetical protein
MEGVEWVLFGLMKGQRAASCELANEPPLLLPTPVFLKEEKFMVPYSSIDNAHRMYNVHPKLFDIPFDV